MRQLWMIWILLLLQPLWLAAPVFAEAPDPQAALHVLNRLAYGPRPGDLAAVQAMGVDHYIEQQLDPESIPLPDSLLQALAGLPGYGLSAADLFRAFGPPGKAADMDDNAKEAYKRQQRLIAQAAVQARLLQAVESPRQLQEVMTEFWFNHFNIFEGKGLDRIWVANFEDTAIRPYALGKFRDLLGATAHHPAMLFYLDNWQSSAPGKVLPRRPKLNGLNENYARELLELHTLGVNGGYTQDDVIALARILTGWTIDRKGMQDGSDEAFLFNARQHDDGDKVLLGQTIHGGGEEEGEQALDMLAASPATARHISYQLAQFFVADEPDAALVDKLTRTFQHSGGDIRAVLREIFSSRAFRSQASENNKFKTPYEFAVSALRASGQPLANPRPLAGFLHQAGQPVYGWLTPDGYKNTVDAWLNPDATLRRINFATALGTGHMPVAVMQDDDASPPVIKNAQALVASDLLQTLGPQIGQASRDAIAPAPAGMQAALVLGSPDFMWR